MIQIIFSIILVCAVIVYVSSCVKKWKEQDAFIKYLKELQKQQPEYWRANPK